METNRELVAQWTWAFEEVNRLKTIETGYNEMLEYYQNLKEEHHLCGLRHADNERKIARYQNMQKTINQQSQEIISHRTPSPEIKRSSEMQQEQCESLGM